MTGPLAIVICPQKDGWWVFFFSVGWGWEEWRVNLSLSEFPAGITIETTKMEPRTFNSALKKPHTIMMGIVLNQVFKAKILLDTSIIHDAHHNCDLLKMY